MSMPASIDPIAASTTEVGITVPAGVGFATVFTALCRLSEPITSPGRTPPSNRAGCTIRRRAGSVSRFEMTWLFERSTIVSSVLSQAQPPSVPALTVASGPMLQPAGTGRYRVVSCCASGIVVSMTSVRTVAPS